MTKTPAILYPMFALAAWTLLVLLSVPILRFRAAFRRQVTAGDFRYGESPRVPPEVSLPNRNYMNLLELPVLFYMVCLVLYVAVDVRPSAVNLAWVFVALRVLHSVVHLTYNNVLHRLTVFTLSVAVLIGLWVYAFFGLT